MKRMLSVILCISVLVSCFAFSQASEISAANDIAFNNIYETSDTLDITNTSSFKYAVPVLNSTSGALKTKLSQDTSIKTPLCNVAVGFDGASVISSIDGSVTGPVAGKSHEAIRLQWVNRVFVADNNTIMFYVELPDYAKAGATWGLDIYSLYIKQDGVKYYINKGAGVNYSFLSSKSDKWQYATTKTVNGIETVMADIPSGFKGYVRIDISSATFWESNGKKADLSKYYRLVELGFGYNAVGGNCGELIFGGLFYYPEKDKTNATLLNYFDMYYYELGKNADSVAAVAYAAKWNASITNLSGGTVECSYSDYAASCAGGENGISIDSNNGSVITASHRLTRIWSNIKMQPGVDTFMMYVELPEFSSNTPALYLEMPATKQNESWMTYIDPAGAEYYYLSNDGTSWQRGVVGTKGELSELGSGFKGYIKFDLKKFAFYTSGTSIKSTYDFTKHYNIECIQLKFNHIGGENGKLVIGSFYSVLKDSDSTNIVLVSAVDGSEEALSATSVQAMSGTSYVLNGTDLQLEKENSSIQTAYDKASGFDGALRISGKNGATANGNFLMKSVKSEVAAGGGLMFYAELPDFKANDADWALALSSVKLTQNGKTFTANLAKRSEFLYLPLTDDEWQEGSIHTINDNKAVFVGLPSGFKGYICIDPANLQFNETYKLDYYSNYTLAELGLGFNSAGGKCGDLILGGILYFLNRSTSLTCDIAIGNRAYMLNRNSAAIIADSGNTSMKYGSDTFMAYFELPQTSSDTSLFITSLGAKQNNSAVKNIDFSTGKYSYMSVYDGEWKNADIVENGKLSEIKSGFCGYVKIDLKTLKGFDAAGINANQNYELADYRFKFDGKNILPNKIYSVTEDSATSYIATSSGRRVTATRFIYGDFVPDGAVNADDIALVRKAILGLYEVEGSALQRADANLDGELFNVKDLVRMKKIAAGTEEPQKWQEKTDESGLTVSKWLEGGVIPYYTEGTITQKVAGDGTKVMTAVGTTAATYNKYLKALEYVGFELYTTNNAGGNLFATYTNADLTVNAYFIESNSTARIVWEPKSYLPGLAEENVYDTTNKVQTTITGIDLKQEPRPEGMLFVIKLEDNSFIVYDGGVADGYNSHGKLLYDHLVSQTPAGEKPVIAAWIFSHAHADHVGNFNEFSMNYYDDVVIEKLYYNFPSDEDIAARSPDIMGTLITEYGMTKKVFDEYYYNVPAVKVHTGNKFYVRNAEFEVLQTFEDFYPTELVDENFNSTSTIYRMYVDGQSILLLGDATPSAETLMVQQFGDYLKSDVIQLAHHGLDGTLASYKVYDPTYCLWPGAKQFYYQCNTYAHNNWLLKESPNVKQVIVTGFGTYTTKLPMDIKGDYPEHIYDKSYVNPSYID